MDDEIEITEKSDNILYSINIPGWLTLLIIVTPIAIIIWQPIWGSLSLFILLGVVAILMFLHKILKNAQFWSFSKFFVGIIIYVIGVLASMGVSAYIGTTSAVYITAVLMFLLLIPAYILSNMMYSFIYDKNRIHREFRFKAQNFIRPNRDKNSNSVELANKNCIVKLYENNDSFIIYWDKIKQIAYAATINNKVDSIKLFAMLSKYFNFDTEISDITAILKGVNAMNPKFEIENMYESKVIKNLAMLSDKVKNIEINEFSEDFKKVSINNMYESKVIKNLAMLSDKVKNIDINKFSEDFKKVSINNMSVAELICLPGINMGKAYKINKYLQSNEFTNYDEFINIAQINQDDSKEIQEIFNNYIE